MDTLKKRLYSILIFCALLGIYLLSRGYISSDVRRIADGVAWVILLLGVLSLIFMKEKYRRPSRPATKEELRKLGDVFVDNLAKSGKDVKKITAADISEALKYADAEVVRRREAEKKKEGES